MVFNEKQLLMLRKYINDFYNIINNKRIKKIKKKLLHASIWYYIIKKHNVPISANYIVNVFNVKISSINNTLKKMKLDIPHSTSEEKIISYCKHFSMFKNFNTEKIYNICIKLLRETNINSELPLVCAVLFKTKIFKEIELSEITGISEGTIRNYRRKIDNIIRKSI